MYCTGCGETLPDAVSFCTHCGTESRKSIPETERGLDVIARESDEIAGMTERSETGEPGPESPLTPPGLEESTEPTETAFCTGCGMRLDGPTAFCTSCGTVTAAAARSDAPPTPVAPAHPQGSPRPGLDNEAATPAATTATTATTAAPVYTSEISSSESPTLCRSCGEDLEPTAAYCISCGTPAAEPGAVVDTPRPADKGRSGKVIALGLFAIGVILLAAAGAWFTLSRGDSTGSNDVGAAPEFQQGASSGSATSDPEVAPTTDPPIPSTVATRSCTELATTSAETALDFAKGFVGSSIQDLASNARIGRDLLPGIAEYNESTSRLSAQAVSQGCEESGLRRDYDDALANGANLSNGSVRLAYAAISDSTFGQGDPVDVITATLLFYPIHGAIPTQAVPPPVEPPRWVAILDSLDTSEMTSADATARANSFTADGIPADFLLTDAYASLNQGYWAVFAGPFADRSAARDYCGTIRDRVPGCYQRYVQTFPTTSPPYGRCGPYGMIDVTGIASNDTLAITARPQDGQRIIGTLPDTAAGILVAGPPIAADGLWTPVTYGPEIGWIRNEFAADNPSCPRTTPSTAIRSCADIASATLEVFKAISTEATAIEATGNLDLAATSSGTFDATVSRLVEDASTSRCSALELNGLLSAGRDEIPSEGTLALLVKRALYAEGFFIDG